MPHEDASAAVTFSALPMSDTTVGYARLFFNAIRSGRYFYHEYINEAEFWNEYDLVVMHSRDVDVAWTMLVAPVVFVGARFEHDFAFAVQAERVAAESASFFVTHYRVIQQWPVHRRVHVYRGLLLFAYAMRVLKQYDETPFIYLETARRILDDPQVAQLIPSSVVRMSLLIPHFSISRLIASSHQSVASLTSSAVEQCHDEQLTFTQCKYLKLKRLLRDELSIPDEDSELELGCEYDERTDISDDVGMDDIKYELDEVTYHITYSVATDFKDPLTIDPYWALFILIKAERAATTQRKIFINDFKAIIYQMLGKTVLAIHAARRSIRLCMDLEITVGHPPPLLPLTRAVNILVEWDDAVDALFLIKNAIRILINVTNVIISVRPELPVLSTSLQIKVGEHEHRLAQNVRDSRSALENQVFKYLNRDLNPELTQAAAELVERNQQFERLRQIKETIERYQLFFRTISTSVSTMSSSSTITSRMTEFPPLQYV